MVKRDKKPFDRSKFMKERHENAKFQRQVFKDRFGKELDYSEFLKVNDNPFRDKLVTYDVSFQVNYLGKFDDIFMSSQTFTVTAYKQSEPEIRSRVMNLVLDSKGKITERGFTGNQVKAVKDNLSIPITPRGAELNEKKLSYEEITRLINNDFVVRGLDKGIKIKNRRGSTGDMKLDIRHFFN